MDTAVSCPVCTLYLREGVSLQTHLNTHPKDQVIEALLKYCSSVRDGSAPSEVESVLAAQFPGEPGSEAPTAAGEPAEAPAPQQYPPSSSHFTAAVTYQQFMSSNASVGGTVLPQCFSVPAIIATPTGEVGPATLMPLLYNPYVLQQQQQQLQFYNAFRTVPQQPLQRQILSPSALFPVSPQFSVVPGGNPVFPNNVPVSSSSATTLQSGEVVQSNSSMFAPAVANGCQEAKCADKDQTIPSAPESPKLKDAEDKPSSPKNVSQCIERQESSENVQEKYAEPIISDIASVVHEEILDSESTLSSQSGAKSSSNNSVYENESSRNKTVPENSNKTSESEEGSVLLDDEVTCTGDTHFNPVSPSLRVRRDLSKINSESGEDNVEDNRSNEVNNSHVESEVIEERGEISATVMKCAEDQGWGFLAEAEKNVPEVCPLNSKEKVSSEYITSDLYSEEGADCEVENGSPSSQVLCVPPTCRDSTAPADDRHFKVVDIEGIHVLVPTHFLAEGNHVANDSSETDLRPSAQTNHCSDPTDCETEGSAAANQDIQADEVMPPMGELSGQESLGENDAGSWSQEKEDVATSYDLLAREKWEVSDGSDEEADAALALRKLRAPAATPASTTALTTAPTPAPASERAPTPAPVPEPTPAPAKPHSYSRPHSLLALQHTAPRQPPAPPPTPPPAPLSPQGGPLAPSTPPDAAKLKKKKREKLRCVYKCWTCDEAFTCPKERRVHQAERHGAGRAPVSKATHAAGAGSAAAGAPPAQPPPLPPPPPPPPPLSSPSLPLKEEESEAVKEEKVDTDAASVAEVRVKAESEPDAEGGAEADADVDADLEGLGDDGGAPPASFDDDDDCIKGFKALQEDDQALELQVPAAGDEESAFKYICSRCETVFSTAKSLHRHVRSAHGHSQFTCRTCTEKFPSETTYLAHLKVHPLECSRCGKYFYRHQNLNLHIRRHLGIKPFKCSICDKSFVTKQKLAEHTNTHTGNTPIKCGQCSETFRRYSNLIQHKNRHHLKLKKKVKDFVCQCGEVFHSQKKLQWHKEIHDEKPKTCSYCSERFVHSSSLTRHIRKAHDQRYFPCSGREADNVECPVCGCVFLKSSLAVHMRLHNGERPFGCHICGKSFSTKWNLQLHRWTHASRSLKPFKCSLCKSAFIRHSEYTAHMHSHRNVRPYTCNYCGSQFIRKYNCIRHAREHEGEKAFSCDVCHKAFHRRYYLKEHMRIHSGARPFACHICGKTSSTKSNHNKHVKIHHAREAVNTEG